MQKNRTKLNQRMLPFFLGGFLMLGGCSVFVAGEPIKEIDDEEAHAFEDGFIYIYRESDEEEKFIDQMNEAFSEEGEVLNLFNIREHADDLTVRTSDYGLNMNYNALAYYSKGELIEQIKMDDLNNEVDPDVIHRALADFIEFNQE